MPAEQRPQTAAPSRRSSGSSFWKDHPILTIATIVVGIPGAVLASCQLLEPEPDAVDVGAAHNEVDATDVGAAHNEVDATPIESPTLIESPTPVEPPDEPPFEIDAFSLVRLYHSGNEVAANDQVRGRSLLVSGAVNRVQDARSPIVYLRGPDDLFYRVVCRLDAGQRPLARVLTSGQVITVIGTGAGARYGNPELTDCRILSASAAGRSR
ncbi:MAG: hypothetical protein OXG04_20190 [Acidobacteria bacterium]|nr:hypothetical protein [Acidobacteriota bacterium]